MATATFPSFGEVDISIEDWSGVVYYNSQNDDQDSLGYNIASVISTSPYVSATYLGGGQIALTTKALGPETGYSLSMNVTDGCVDGTRPCDPPADASGYNFTAGHN